MKKSKIANNKGITLVTLVVTIIVVLILSGITISTMTGENGILTKAAEAKQKTEIAALKEKISLIMLDWETDKALDSTVTVEDFWERLIDEGIIIDENDISEPEADGTNKVYTIDTGDGYVIEIVVSPNENITIGDIAKGTDLPLKIKSIDVTEKSTNSISVEVRVRENEGKGDLKLSYYYKTGEGEYEPLEEDTTDRTSTFTGLQQGTTYNIKVVVEKDGQTDELDRNVKTEELKEGKVTASLPEWDATTHTASITLTTESNYQIQYQEGGTEGEWTTVAKGTKSVEISNLDHNDIIYARLWDGHNGGYEEKITVKDIEDPTVTVTEGTVTTNSIQVSVSSSDNEGGMPETPIYKYYHKKKADTDYPSEADKTGTETTWTFNGLDQKAEYDIKVTTQDAAGNEGEGELTSIETGTVLAAIEDLATAPITASVPIWNTSHTASITLSTDTNYQIQYQIGGIDGDWSTVDEGQNSATISDLNHNDTVFARLWDGNNAGNYASVTIKDDIAPEKATIDLTSTKITVGENITATVEQADNESGVKIEACKWIFTTSSDEIGADPDDYTGEMSGIFTSISENIQCEASTVGTYYLHVLTVDNANKSTETVSSNSVKVTGEEIRANDIATDPEVFKEVVGGIVTNYEAEIDKDSTDKTEWKIFYADEKGIYLIASDYVPVSKLASQKTSLGFLYNGKYNIYWDYNSGNGNFKVTSITDTMASRFMLTQKTKLNTGNANYKMTACLIDGTKWNTFRDKDNKWAEVDNIIGGPTLEMYVASWNKKYPDDKLYTGVNATGYNISTSSTVATNAYDVNMSSTPGYIDTLYYPHQEKWNDCSGYWLASPSATYEDSVMCSHYNGRVTGEIYDLASFGVRPLVHLKSNAVIKKAGDNYELELVPISAEDMVTNDETFQRVAGKMVTNYEAEVDNENTEKIEWKIFYADDKGIYLIASDYVPVSKLTSQKTSLGFDDDGKYNIYWNSTDQNFKVTSITDTMATRFMLTQKSKLNTGNANYKMAACLMDATKWNTFRDKDNKWTEEDNIIGSPSLEMYAASWNKKYPANKIYTGVNATTNATGYNISTSSTVATNAYSINMKSTPGYSETLYYPHKTQYDGCNGYWLASPCCYEPDSEMCVRCGGNVNGNTYSDTYYGVRPLVRLKSNIILEEVDGDYMLAYKSE